MDDIDLKDMTIEYLRETPVGKDLDKAFVLYERAQQAALALSNIGGSDDLTLTKIGTVLSLNLFGTLLGGKRPDDLTKEDWEKIAKEVTDKAVLAEDRDYSIYVFDLYADYIDTSAKVLLNKATGEKLQGKIGIIQELSEELRIMKERLLNDEITEAAYIERCMWISLDGMIKCMAAYISCFTSDEVGEFIQAATALAFEYGRLKLYRKEQALLNEYLRDQELLDDQLQVRFEAFKKELQEEADKFNSLIDDAFDTDFRNTLKGSAALAQNVGVNDEEILHNVDEVDDFFLN